MCHTRSVFEKLSRKIRFLSEERELSRWSVCLKQVGKKLKPGRASTTERKESTCQMRSNLPNGSPGVLDWNGLHWGLRNTRPSRISFNLFSWLERPLRTWRSDSFPGNCELPRHSAILLSYQKLHATTGAQNECFLTNDPRDSNSFF